MKISSAKEEEEMKKKESLISNKVRKVCSKEETLEAMHHLNEAVVMQAMNLFNSNAISHFQKMRQNYHWICFLLKVAKIRKLFH